MEEERDINIEPKIEDRILKNTGYFTMALVLQKIISFIYFSYLATQIGSVNTGKYFFAVSFVTIFSVFIDFGLGNLLIRESAKKENDPRKLLANAISIKLISSIIVVLAIFITINILNYPLSTKELIGLASITIILDNFTLIFFSIIRGKHNLKYESIGSVIYQLIIMISGFIILKKTHNLTALISVLVIASLFYNIFSSLVLKLKYKISFKPEFDKKFIKNLLIMSTPFAIAAIFVRISGNIDSIFLSKLADEKALGYYSLPSKITFAFQFIPMAFSASLYPAFTHLVNTNSQKLQKILNKSISYLLFISLPISIGIVYIAQNVMAKIYGSEFLPSILTLQILILNLPFLFLTFPTGALLNSANLQKTHTKNIGLTMILGIILNLILIPFYAQNGSAISSVTCSIFYMILNFVSINKILILDYKKTIFYTLKVIIACIAMLIIMFALKNSLNWIICIVIGAISYLLFSFILKIIKKEDFYLIKSKFID